MSEIFDFKDRFIVTTQGRDIEIDHIALNEPTAKCLNHCLVIKQEYSKAQMEAAKMNSAADLNEEVMAELTKQQAEKEKSDEITEDDVKSVLHIMFMGGCNVERCFDAFWKILKATNSKFMGEHKATSDFTDCIPYKETERLLGFYIANFILTS